MYAVMIVDDEVAIREKLPRLIDFESYGFSVRATAKNGAEAMKLLPECEPDLILLDVRMPVMDGIGFLRELRRGPYRHVQVVILSGYSDFAYAKQAMAYGAKAYLTKPVDEDEAIDCLREIASLLETREREGALLRFQGDLAALKQAHVENGKIALEHPCWLLHILPYQISPPLAEVNPYPAFQRAICRLTGQGEDGLFLRTGYVYSFLIPQGGSQEPEAFVEELDQLLTEEGLDCAFFLDAKLLDCPGPFRDAHEAHLGRFLREHFYAPRKQLSYADLKKDIPSPPRDFLDDLYARLRKEVPLLEEDKVAETMALLFERVDIHRPGMTELRNITDRLYYLLTSLVTASGHSGVERPVLAKTAWQTTPVSYCFRLWREFESGQVGETLAFLRRSREVKCSGVDGALLEYVREHFNQPISIKELARRFAMNPAYLGRFFQKTAGQSLKQYVNQLRMEEAKRLLLGTDKLIYEIAEEVGFSESSYFIARFTKEVGISPMEFRKQ